MYFFSFQFILLNKYDRYGDALSMNA
ncbi:hypothetical protein MPC1_17980001 [Methylocella tundrae]|nr:hypothetical protein MPC1_17980001 [Methylocella tundrae]